MSNLKRYHIDSAGRSVLVVDDGEWVKFEDIKHLLPTGAQQPQGAIPPEQTAPHAADVGCNSRGNMKGCANDKRM